MANSVRYSDVNLTFAPHPITGNLSVLEDVAAVKRALRNLILTKRMEIPYHPLQGSNVTALLFENFTSFTAFQLKKEIETTIRNYEPRVNLMDVTVITREDEHRVDVQITFAVANVAEPVTITLFLERTR